MAKNFYAGRNTYGVGVSYETGWYVAIFPNKKDRDEWVEEQNWRDAARIGNRTCEAISRDTARRIMGSRCKVGGEIITAVDSSGRVVETHPTGRWLEEDDGYYNPHFWG